MNPKAFNYNSQADTEDYSCKYIMKGNGLCHLFKDVLPQQMIERSFTLSYSVAGESWVFFHDYFPDFYIAAREDLYSLKDNLIYKHHDGQPGRYYQDPTLPPYSFFIDVVFSAESFMLLETINWITEYLNANDTESRFTTLSHISVWNGTQHTGRISLSQIWDGLSYDNIRNTQGEWNLNKFRDVLADNVGDFLQDIFHNYALDPSKVNNSPVWYEQLLMEDKWFCIRFEFDNKQPGQLVLHDTMIDVLKSDR